MHVDFSVRCIVDPALLDGIKDDFYLGRVLSAFGNSVYGAVKRRFRAGYIQRSITDWPDVGEIPSLRFEYSPEIAVTIAGAVLENRKAAVEQFIVTKWAEYATNGSFARARQITGGKLGR